MPHRCWTNRQLSPLMRQVLADSGVRFPPGGPYSLYLPRTSGRFAADSRQLSVPSDVLVGALAGCGYLTGKRACWVRLVQVMGRAQAQTLTPPTWLLDNERDRRQLAEAYAPGLYVLKARREHRQGLRLVSELSEILAVKEDIVQRVVTDGLTLQGRCVQLRLYLLLTQHRGKLAAWLYDDARCLYGATEGSDFDRLILTKQVHPRTGLPTTLSGLIADPRTPLKSALHADIQALLGRIVGATAPRIMAERHLDHARCYQLFGVDVILTRAGRPIFIEANKGPAMVPTSRDDERFKKRMLRRMLQTAGVIEGSGAGFVPLPVRFPRPRA